MFEPNSTFVLLIYIFCYWYMMKEWMPLSLLPNLIIFSPLQFTRLQPFLTTIRYEMLCETPFCIKWETRFGVKELLMCRVGQGMLYMAQSELNKGSGSRARLTGPPTPGVSQPSRAQTTARTRSLMSALNIPGRADQIGTWWPISYWGSTSMKAGNKFRGPASQEFIWA